MKNKRFKEILKNSSKLSNHLWKHCLYNQRNERTKRSAVTELFDSIRDGKNKKSWINANHETG